MTVYKCKKQKVKTKKFSISQFNFRVFIVCSTVALTLIYLVSINNTATKGIEISQMERAINSLDEENRALEIQASQLRSLERIEKLSNEELNMVAAGSYQYLPVMTSGAVAVK